MKIISGTRIFYEGDDRYPDVPPGYGWVVAIRRREEVVIQWDCDGEETCYYAYGKAWRELLLKISIICSTSYRGD